MKRTDAGFTPFSLTVETEEEARLLAALIGACNPSVARCLGISESVALDAYRLVKDYHPGKSINITVIPSPQQ